MKQKHKKFTQTDFAALFPKMDQPQASRLLNGKEKVGFPLAVELSRLFPAKGILDWKNASAEDLNRLYNQLRREAEVA